MSALFRKLNLKDQERILILNAPKSFEKALKLLEGISILRDFNEVDTINFVLAFVQTADEIEQFTKPISDKAPGDAVIWFAYPKTTSKKYDVQINRDQGWEALEKAGFKCVRQVAIDQDWSALRFRRKEFVGN
jgi:hypothetical protein